MIKLADLEKRTFTKAKIVTTTLQLYSKRLDHNKPKADLINEFLALQDEAMGITAPITEKPEEPTYEMESKLQEKTEEELSEYTHFMVRYVGRDGGGISHNSNSTPSKTAYNFGHGEWVEVKKQDFFEKYFLKTTRAIEAGKPPHFECGRAKKDDAGTMIDIIVIYGDEIKKLLNKPINALIDLTDITEYQLTRLKTSGITDLPSFMAIPDEWYVSNFGIDRTRLQHWRDEAQRGIVVQRQRIAEQIILAKGE